MKIQNNTDNTLNTSSTSTETSKEVSDDYICRAEINISDGSLKFAIDRKKGHDAQKIYFVNKDGSGRKISAWGAVNYSKGTLSKLFDSVKKTCNEKQTTILSDEEIIFFINEFESIIG